MPWHAKLDVLAATCRRAFRLASAAASAGRSRRDRSVDRSVVALRAGAVVIPSFCSNLQNQVSSLAGESITGGNSQSRVVRFRTPPWTWNPKERSISPIGRHRKAPETLTI
jgi:hypothetical protein